MISKVGSPPLDILIRTSGVKRLSDYMLWQVRSSFYRPWVASADCDAVLWRYTNTYAANILAGYQFLGSCTSRVGLPAKGMDPERYRPMTSTWIFVCIPFFRRCLLFYCNLHIIIDFFFLRVLSTEPSLVTSKGAFLRIRNWLKRSMSG